MRFLLPLCMVLAAACAQAPPPNRPAYTLQPYSTHTPAHTLTPAILAADTPLPTATPITYVIREGDTLSQLAEKHNLASDDLLAANPELDPGNLPIGKTILIPSGTSAGAATPAPIPVPLTQAVCHPSGDAGLWCFALVHNNTQGTLESISVQIDLIDSNAAVLASQPAFPPLDILPPGSSLPAYAFFPNAPAEAYPRVQLMSAYQLSTSSTRYLPAMLDNTLIEIDQHGRTAQVSGQIRLPAESKAAAQVWVAAVAYDRQGTVVGVKRWEGGALQPGGGIPFQFTVASAGSGIDAVDFVVQAMP